MLHAIIGKMGTGKSALLSYYTYLAYLRGQSIYANYTLFFEHEKLNVDKLLTKKLRNVFIGIDEADKYFTKMRANSKAVQDMQMFLMQSRKRGTDTFFVLKSWDLVLSDIKALIEDYTSFYFPQPFNSRGYPATIEDIEKHRISKICVRCKSPYKERVFIFNPAPYFSIYNTDEIIFDIFQKKKPKMDTSQNEGKYTKRMEKEDRKEHIKKIEDDRKIAESYR